MQRFEALQSVVGRRRRTSKQSKQQSEGKEEKNMLASVESQKSKEVFQGGNGQLN